MQLKDGFNLTASVIERMKEVFNSLPGEQKSKCALCNETLTDVVKRIEAEAQVSNREACRFVGAEVGISERTARGRVERFENAGGPKRAKEPEKPQSLSIIEKVAEKKVTNDGEKVTQKAAIEVVAKETGKTQAAVKQEIYREQKKYAEKQTFNRTNDSTIEWAKYTWNPVTGCEHGCTYCYARKIADRRMGAYKDIGFKPHFHEERLSATENLPANVPDEDKFCFVVSMGDLFGEWVPKEWIDKVMAAIRKAPDWTFLLLTKNPRRYAELGLEIGPDGEELGVDYFPENCWLGASGGTQKLVNAAVNAFTKLDCANLMQTTFLSCEPLLNPIAFCESWSNRDAYDSAYWSPTSQISWVIVGAQTNPEIQPETEWVKSIISQCVDTDTKLYFKPNLKFRPVERP